MTGSVRSAAFSGDGKRVVTASSDKTARIWDAESGKEIAVLKGHTGLVRSAAFSADGKRVVTASDDNTARIWDAESGKEIAVLKGHTGREERGVQRRRQAGGDGVFGQDRAHLGCGERQGDRRPERPYGPVQSAAFSGDGKRVVTASADKTARIWDAESGKEIAVLKGHTGSVSQRGVQRRRQAGGDGVFGQHRAHLGCGERQGDRRPERPCRLRVERGVQRRRQAGGDGV